MFTNTIIQEIGKHNQQRNLEIMHVKEHDIYNIRDILYKLNVSDEEKVRWNDSLIFDKFHLIVDFNNWIDNSYLHTVYNLQFWIMNLSNLSI